MTQITNNPYVGPRTFTKNERDRFFGREQEARDLISLIISERLVLFYAQSGAGKSSLINTRILPQLVEKEGFIALPVGRVSGELPHGVPDVDNIFAFNLMSAIDQERPDPNLFANMTLPQFLAGLTTTDGEHYYYEDVSADETVAVDIEHEQPPHILIIDQFEEIVTTHLTRWQQREAFFQQLNKAMQEDPLLWVVLSLREDYVAALRPYQRIMYNNMRARFYMKRMEAEAALQAIEAPAALGNRPFAPGVADILVNNLRQIRVQGEQRTQPGQFIEPVQLQVVCYQLWHNLEASPNPQITQQDLEELGDVDTALAQFYEQAVANVRSKTHISEIELRNWFDTRLITEAGTRGTVYQGPNETAGLNNDVVRLLADQYLLRGEMRAGGTWYELVHDRFVDPILKANQAWRLQQSPLVQAAETWSRSDYSRDKLYKGDQLKEVLIGLDREAQEPLVKEFLTTSEEAQSQRDLDATKVLMEEERRRAAAKARTAQRLRWLSIGLGIMFVFALAASVMAALAYSGAESSRAEAVANEQFALTQQAEAVINANLAATSEAEARENAFAAATSEVNARNSASLAATSEAQAVANAQLAATNEAEAVINAERAVSSEAESQRLSRISLAQSLAAVAPRIVDRTNDTELATLLSLEALYVNREIDNEDVELIDSSLRDILGRPYFNTVLSGHEGWVEAVAFSPDGQLLASADNAGNLILWNLASHSSDFTVITTETAVEFYYAALRFSPDGQFLASVNQVGGIDLWDLRGFVPGTAESPPLVATFSGQIGYVTLFAFSPDGQIITAITDINSLVRWDVNNPGQPPRELLTANRISGKLLTLSDDGHYAISALRATVYIRDLWDPGLGTPQFFTSGLGYDVTHAVFRADGQFLATADNRNNIAVWDFTDPGSVVDPLRFNIPQESSIGALAFSGDGQNLVSISYEITDLAVHLWNINRRNSLSVNLSGHNSNLNVVAFSADGRFLATGSDDSDIRLWDLAIPQAAAVKLTTEPEPFIARYSSDGQQLFSWNSDNTFYAWETDDLADGLTIYPIPTEVMVADIHPDTQLAASSNFTGDLTIWQLENGNLLEVNSWTTGYANANGVLFSPNGQLITIWDDLVISVWDVNSGEETAVLTNLADSMTAVAFSPDGQFVAAADRNYLIYIWSLDNPETPVVFDSGHDAWINALTFDPSGQQIATASDDLTARIWQLDEILTDGAPLVLPGHVDWVLSVAFSPDGATLATGSWDRSIRLWDLTTEDPGIAPTLLTGHGAIVDSLMFSPDGGNLASASDDHTVRLWRVSINSFVQIACQQVRRNLTLLEWRRYLEGDDYRRTCPNLPVHPSLLVAARRLAQEGQVAEAQALFAEIMRADPDLVLDVQMEIQQAQAEALVAEAEALVWEGDVEGALAKYEQALNLYPDLGLDPLVEINRLTVQRLVDEAYALLSEGDVPAALEKFAEAKTLSAAEITAADWNVLCWEGSLRGFASEVLEACETAVSLAPEDGWIRDSRALARALTNDFAGAIADYQYFLIWAVNKVDAEEIAQRRAWLNALFVGRNPFDQATLEALRQE